MKEPYPNLGRAYDVRDPLDWDAGGKSDTTRGIKLQALDNELKATREEITALDSLANVWGAAVRLDAMRAARSDGKNIARMSKLEWDAYVAGAKVRLSAFLATCHVDE